MGYPHPSHPKETPVLSRHFGEAEARTYDGWAARGGWEALRKALAMAPDAVVELSRSLVALKKPADACQTLNEFKRRYPKAPAAVASRAAAARTQAKCAA